jgi:hypothetical protein
VHAVPDDRVERSAPVACRGVPFESSPCFFRCGPEIRIDRRFGSCYKVQRNALAIMVMFSGYENFVSRIDIDEDTEKLGWLGKLDAGTLKLKVAASIVAISSIHLLRAFMNAPQIPNDKLMWYVIIHLTFVVSAVMMGVLDKMSFAAHRQH